MNEFETLIFVETKQKKLPIFWIVLFMLISLGIFAIHLGVINGILSILFFFVLLTMYSVYRFNIYHLGQKEKLDGYFDGVLKLDSERIKISNEEYLMKNIKSIKFHCDNIHGTVRSSYLTGRSITNGETNIIKLTLKDGSIREKKFKLLSENHTRQLDDWITSKKDEIEIIAIWSVDIFKIRKKTMLNTL